MFIDCTMWEHTSLLTGYNWSEPGKRELGKTVDCRSHIVNSKSYPPLLPGRTDIRRSSSGFTFVELIVVIICLAILVSTAVVKFQISDQDRAVIAADQLIADIQYVQMRSMGIGSQQNLLFSTGTSSYSIREGLNVIEQKSLPDDVIIRSTTNLPGNMLTFNTLGEPTFGSSGSASINVGRGSSPNKTLTVLAITGKVQ